MTGFASKAAPLRQEVSEAGKEADEQRAMLSSLGQVVEEVPIIKGEASMSFLPFLQAHEHRISLNTLAPKQEIEIGQLKDHEKRLDRDLASAS